MNNALLLTEPEQVEFASCETVIDHHLRDFIEVGNALLTIRDKRLYRTSHKTFEAYCEERWKLPRRQAYRFMDAAQVVENVSNWTQIAPINEAQARPLTALEPGHQLEVWQKAIDTAPNGKLTVRKGKHGGYRAVPLTREVRAAMSAYLEHYPDAKSDVPLWMGTRGELSHRSSVVRLLNKYAYQAGTEEFNPHVLRHTFATRYLDENPGDLRGLAALLGHANLNTVMIYTEPRLEDLAERMERVELQG